VRPSFAFLILLCATVSISFGSGNWSISGGPNSSLAENALFQMSYAPGVDNGTIIASSPNHLILFMDGNSLGKTATLCTDAFSSGNCSNSTKVYLNVSNSLQFVGILAKNNSTVNDASLPVAPANSTSPKSGGIPLPPQFEFYLSIAAVIAITGHYFLSRRT
jgi:hypothetical protein